MSALVGKRFKVVEGPFLKARTNLVENHGLPSLTEDFLLDLDQRASAELQAQPQNWVQLIRAVIALHRH